MNKFRPITDEIRQKLIERIAFLKKKIADFETPITPEDYKDHFKSRLSGDKSTRALKEYFEELLIREGELRDLSNYIYILNREKELKEKGEQICS